MLDSGNERMHFAQSGPAMLALILIVTFPLAIGAQQAPAGDKPSAGESAVALASPGPLVRLLPDALAGHKATSDLKLVARDNIVDLVADKATIYQEYLVISAVSREYAGARVDVFETRNEFAALGLFQFNSGARKTRNAGIEIGSGGARLDGGLLFWKGNFFVRVADGNQKPARGTSAVHEALARAVANSIVPTTPAVSRPPLFESLPDSLPGVSLVPNSERYFLGPESLNTFVEHGREMFEFVGDTEAVAGEYTKGEGENNGVSQVQATDQTKGGSNARAAAVPAGLPLKLVIVECHTPEFATDAMARATSYISSLPEIEQQQIVFKRTGNYIVAAMNVGDREFAEGLVNSVQYTYTVKWLRNPLWPTNDPFRAQKAAEMLLSTFGLLGLILLTVLVGGTIFGTSVFLKRRKQQRGVFSDAGGMLRLDIEPFVLALPPKRDK